MLTLYHSPMSRSTRITQLLRELNALDRVNVEIVTVTRIDGSGGIDPANPHPEGKVPLLVHDGVEIRESIAIAQYLAELFPEAGLSVPPGDQMRGGPARPPADRAGALERQKEAVRGEGIGPGAGAVPVGGGDAVERGEDGDVEGSGHDA